MLRTAISALMAMTLSFAPASAFARGSANDDLVVVAPDAAYVASEIERARAVFAATTAPVAVRVAHAPIAETALVRPAARTFTPFAVIDPATGKAVPRTATIVLTTGKRKGQSVNAGTYWDQVNMLEKAAAASGASLRDNKPLVTGVLRYRPSIIKGGASSTSALITKAQIGADIGTIRALGEKPSVLTDYPKSLAPPAVGEIHVTGNPALHAQYSAVSLATAPMPCLNAPTYDVKSIALKADLDAMAPAVTLAGPSPTPTPVAAPQTMMRIPAYGIHPAAPTATPNGRYSTVMRSGANVALAAPVTLVSPSPAPIGKPFTMTLEEPQVLVQHELALEQRKCPSPLSPLPTAYNEANLAAFFGANQTQALSIAEIGDRSIAAVDFGGSVTVGAGPSTARKPAPVLTAAVDAKGYLFDSGSDFLSATATSGGEKAGTVDVEILGQSVANPSLQTGSTAGGTSNTYTILNVDVPIPIIPGIDVDLAANVSGTLGTTYSLDLGSTVVSDRIGLDETGNLNATFNASMDVDALIVDVSGGVRGNLQFAAFDVPANGGLVLIMIDRTIGGKNDRDARHIRDCQLTFSYVSSLGGANVDAMSGTVTAYARECIEYLVGSSCSEQDVTLANFGGTHLTPSSGEPWKTAAVGPRYTDGPSYGIPLGANERFSPDDPTTAVPRACNRFPVQYAN